MALRSRTPDPGTSAFGGEQDAVDLSQEVCDEITWYMRQHKVSRADLAGFMGVSPGRVSQILSGDENLTLRTLNSVVSALGARLELTLRPIDEDPEFAGAHAAS
jgi:transcriptional regulator with XRE-family HTH domain